MLVWARPASGQTRINIKQSDQPLSLMELHARYPIWCSRKLDRCHAYDYNLKHIGGCAERTGERRQSLVLPTVKLSVHSVPCFAYAGKVPWRFQDMNRFKRAFKIKNTQSNLLLRYESNSGGGSFWSLKSSLIHQGKQEKGFPAREPASPMFVGGSPRVDVF